MTEQQLAFDDEEYDVLDVDRTKVDSELDALDAQEDEAQ